MSFNINTMAVINSYDLYQTYNKEYLTWNNNKKLQAAKRQEYLRRNPDAIKDYDLQRAKILLSAVDIMDKSVSENTGKMNLAYESIASLALGYSALGGIALGALLNKTNFVKKNIDKIVLKQPKSKNIILMGIKAVSGVFGVLATYPLYTFISNIESKIYRKRRFDTMEKELQDSKIFVVLNDEQKKIFNEKLSEIEKNKSVKDVLTRNYKSLKQLSKETLNYNREQELFRKKYEEDKTLYEKELSQKEIKEAKKDRVLLSVLIKEINTSAQSYTEKMQKITDNLITLSFAFGSLFALGYERIAKKLKLKTSSLPAGMAVILLAVSTFFATWAQKRAEHVGRFKAKQELVQNPEKLVYISNKKTEEINKNELEIVLNKKQRINSFKFLKEFFKHNKEYKKCKKAKNFSGKDLSKAMENIEISEEQLQDGKRLQKNMFKTFYKVDSNTQKYSSEINIIGESVKYPINLILGTIGSIFGMKQLANIRRAMRPEDIFKHSAKYVGMISLFALPSLIVNSYFAKAQKMGARISDMMTMKELEDYRFFADYSRFEKSNT